MALVAHEKPQLDVQRAYQFIAMGHWANYVVAHMTDITVDQFVAWTLAASQGSADLTTVQSYFESAHALMEADISRLRLVRGRTHELPCGLTYQTRRAIPVSLLMVFSRV